MEHVETGTFASSFLRPAKLPKLDWKTCLCHSGPVSSHEPLVEQPLAEPAIVEDSAGSTPPAIVTDCLHAYFCDSGARLDAPYGFYDRVCYQNSQATSCQTRRISKRRLGGRPSSPVSSRQQSGEGL